MCLPVRDSVSDDFSLAKLPMVSNRKINSSPTKVRFMSIRVTSRVTHLFD